MADGIRDVIPPFVGGLHCGLGNLPDQCGCLGMSSRPSSAGSIAG